MGIWDDDKTLFATPGCPSNKKCRDMNLTNIDHTSHDGGHSGIYWSDHVWVCISSCTLGLHEIWVYTRNVMVPSCITISQKFGGCCWQKCKHQIVSICNPPSEVPKHANGRIFLCYDITVFSTFQPALTRRIPKRLSEPHFPCRACQNSQLPELFSCDWRWDHGGF